MTPIVLSISAVSAHFLPSEERTHRTLAVVIASLGALALVRGYRSHRSFRVLLIMIADCLSFSRAHLWGTDYPRTGSKFSLRSLGADL